MRSVGMRRDAPRNGTSGIPSAYGSLNSVCAVWACGVMLLEMEIAGSLVLKDPLARTPGTRNIETTTHTNNEHAR